MIAFGTCISSPERFDRLARPGIVRASGEQARVLKRHRPTSIFSAYNSILDEARDIPDLEALVLLHDDTEILDDSFSAKLTTLFRDDSIGLAGVIGARGVTSLAWWEADRRGRVSWNGPGLEEGPRVDDFGRETTDVDCVDGLLLALSPWTVHHVRFDDKTFSGFHGYDVDFAFQVRRDGKRVVVTDLELHHHDEARQGFSTRFGFLKTDIRWRAKWGFTPRANVPVQLGLLTLRSKAHSASQRARSVRR